MTESYDAEDFASIVDQEASILNATGNQKVAIAGEVLSMLGEAMFYEGYYDESVGILKKAYSLFEELRLTNGEYYNGVIFNLAFISKELGRYDEAQPYAEKLVKLDKANYGTKSEEYVSSVITLGEIYLTQGHSAEASQLYYSTISELDSASFYEYLIRYEIGTMHIITGDFTEAENTLLYALALVQYLEGSNSLSYSACLTNLATLYQKWGKYAKSERFFLDAIEILNSQGPTSVSESFLSSIQNNLANIYIQMARYDEGMALYSQILERDKNNFGADHPNYAISLLNQSTTLRRMGDYEHALQSLTTSLNILQNTLGEESLEYIMGLGQKAKLHRENSQYQEANQSISEALTRLANFIGEDNFEYSNYLHEQGTLFARQNRIEEAKKVLSQTATLRRKVLSERHPRFAQTTRQLAIVHWQENALEQAISQYQETFNNYFGQIDAYFPALSEPEKAKFYNNTLKVTFEEYNSFAVKNAESHPQLLGDMYDYQLATKALLMYSTSKVRTSILASGDKGLIQQFKDWLSLKERLSKLYSMNQEELALQPEPIGELTERANRLEKLLGEQSREFATTFSNEKVTWQQVRDRLSQGEAAIEIIRYRDFLPDSAGYFTGDIHYAALIVRHDTQSHPELVLIENGKELEADWIAYYRNSIIYRLIDEQSYQHFWQPLKPALAGIKKVFISPDGLYHQISFNTLLNAESGKYLIEELEIEQVTNTKDLVAYADLTQEGFRTGDALFFGFPNYNMGMDAQTLAAAEVAAKVANTVQLDRGLRGSLQRYVKNNELLAMLPGTKTEVESIAMLYKNNNQGYSMFLENEAVEEQIKGIEPPSTLHIATHGFFLEDNPEATAGESDRYVTNPLLRSGLILAGANTFIASGANGSLLTEEDGILTAFEVMNLNLDKTDLVVLSACETGLGTIKNGEGVYGLQRAFRVAGADAVVMSLWSVSDQATQELMTNFYGYWLGGDDKQSAFLKAQQKLKESFPEPYFWGAFVMVGR